ncbi:peptide ABC transporter substrate-binding protein [Oleiharenicola lentus]|uniref:peptide ABC transporter substrate-binding protein n=1 Tax=Oleiharenicola lentus TaxID=2508720 RepID=UPI003F663277
MSRAHILRPLLNFTLTALALGALLAGCGKRETPVEAGLRTNTLLVGNGAEPGSLDPHFASILTDQIIVNALFEGLTLLDEPTTVPQPASAESWSTSADGLTWTFKLRAHLRWSNGEPLTAGDFIATWKRALHPKVAAENAWYLYAIKNAEAYNSGKLTDASALGLAAPDDRTVVITLERPTPYLPALVSLPAWFPVNPRLLEKFHALEAREETWTRPEHFVGNGAFTLKEWNPNARIVVAKNSQHREAATTQLNEVIFFPIEKPDDEERTFRAGQLHVTFNLPVTKISSWRERDAAQLRIDPTLQSNFLRFNTTKPPFNDARVRRALSLAIDRDALAKTVLQASRAPATALTPPNTGSYTARAAVISNIEAAKKLLAEAGFANGQNLPAIEFQARNDEIMPRIAEALQAMWQRDLGVRVSIIQVDQKVWVQNQQSLSYDISTAAWTADFPDAVNFLSLFASDSSYNWTGWKNAAFDQLLNQAAEARDPAARNELLQKSEALLLEEAPISPLHYGAQTYLIDPAVQGWDPAPLVFRRFQKVSFK